MRKPKLTLLNRYTRQWQQVELIESAVLDESQSMFFVQFQLHWKNANLVQQFRRAAHSPTLQPPRKAEFIFYPVPGGKAQRKDFQLRVAAFCVKNGIGHLGGTVSEVQTYDKR